MIPTQSGYYWRRGPNHDGEIVDQVVEVKPILSTAPEELFYWEAGDIGGIYIQPENGVEWTGPVPTMQDLQALEEEWDKLVNILHEYNQDWMLSPVDGVRTLIQRFEEGLIHG